MAEPLRAALDADGDGRVSNAEFAAGVRNFFRAAARNGSDTLSEAQLADELNRLFPARDPQARP